MTAYDPADLDTPQTPRQELLTKAADMLRHFNPEKPVARVWGRHDGADPELTLEGNGWEGSVTDLAEVLGSVFYPDPGPPQGGDDWIDSRGYIGRYVNRWWLMFGNGWGGDFEPLYIVARRGTPWLIYAESAAAAAAHLENATRTRGIS